MKGYRGIMQIDKEILKSDERAAWALRSVYSLYGYSLYKMSKFEEYSLYVKNKDFLVSDGIISFTDTSGRLLALKPDVTLSIIKNSKDEKGCIQKLYYDENVYRITKSSKSYKEIRQTGLECIGDIGKYESAEVLLLAVKSLESLSENFFLELSHAGLFEAILDDAGLVDEYKKLAANAISAKNSGELKGVCARAGISYEKSEELLVFVKNYSTPSEALSEIGGLCRSERARECFKEFNDIINVLYENGVRERIAVDFSLTNEMTYYSGIIFRGFIDGLPGKVISGGRYDKLMRKMGRSSGAIGFAVYLDQLERLDACEKEYDVDLLLICGDDVSRALKMAGEYTAEGKSVRVVKEIPQGIKFQSIVYTDEKGDC